MQRLLAERGRHRAPSIPGPLIAAAAELHQRTVLHVLTNFDLIAELTAQPVERLRIEEHSPQLTLTAVHEFAS